jgi:hypothetical protein
MATDFKEQLVEVRNKMRSYAALQELSDDEAEDLAKLTKLAGKLEVQQATMEQIAKADADNVARIEADKAAAVNAARQEERSKAKLESNRLPFGEAPYATKYSDTSPYDGLDSVDLSLVIDVLKTQGRRPSPAAVKSLMIRVAEAKDDNTLEGRKALAYMKNAFKAETGLEPTLQGIDAAIKTDGDPMYTTGSNIGDKWVGTAYSTELWRAIRAATLVASRIPEIVVPDGYSSNYVPLESTDPTWYKVPEATAGNATLGYPVPTVASATVGTLQKQITLSKIGARVVYTGEMVEDSLIAFVPQLREQLQISGAEILEHICIDGDTEDCTSVNINAIDSQPGEAEVYFAANGFRKLALVTNTANSRSAGGALTIEDFKETLKLMGTAGLGGADPTKVNFIVDPNVHYKAMDMQEVKTRDVNSAATVENGALTQAYGVRIIPSWQMHRVSAKRMAESTGKIDVTDSDNTLGAILAVRWDQWKQAFKRRMTIETLRIPSADAWEITALLRWGLAFRDNEASAITYNVGV